MTLTPALPRLAAMTSFRKSTSAVFFLALSCLLSLLVGCASTDEKEANSPDHLFKAAEELQKDERYEEAIQKFSEVKNKHPYSRFAISAEMHIADIYFARESYIEAQSAYQVFRELHPTHPEVDYVVFRLGLSCFNQLPSSIDRDLTIANKAIAYFEELSRSYPQSKYLAEAKQKHAEARQMLAKKEIYIADFYFKKEQFDSALKRYEGLLKLYSTEGLNQKALLGAGISALEAGERDRGKKHLNRLLEEYPNSAEAGSAKNVFEKFHLK